MALMPPAYNNAAEVAIIHRQLDAMEDGGTVAVSPHFNPARCSPAPYERVSLISSSLKSKKPKSTLKVRDAKERFTIQFLF